MKLKLLIEIEFYDEDKVDTDLIRAEIADCIPAFFGVEEPIFWSAFAITVQADSARIDCGGG